MEKATVIDTNDGLTYVHCAQMKGAINLERVGLKHSSGRSVRKHAAKLMGLKQNAPHQEVIDALQAKMDELLEKRKAEMAQNARQS